VADRQNVWGAQYVDELVFRDGYSGSATGRFYALQDGNWNVVAIAGTDSTVKERYTYSAYGKPEFRDPTTFGLLNNNISAFAWDSLYTGRQYDPETGLQYSRNRCYHPVLGRFISRDPAGYRGGINLYEYVGDDPLVRTDPYGLDGCDKPAPQPKPAPKPAPKPCENAIYYCERDIQPGGADSGDKIARACHWKHIDIYSVCEGQIYHGAGGGQTGSDPGLPKGPGVTCHKVHRQDYYDDWPFAVERKLRWGPKAGTPCSKATMSDIIKCLQARTTDVKPGLVDNCQTDCDSALGECCMSGFTPLTIVPQYPTIPPGGHF
jgi:RHS repeat-associated protein